MEQNNQEYIRAKSTPRPRLKKLIIKNFRGIGQTPVTIELDKIVVLVGPNNAGKSSILRALLWEKERWSMSRYPGFNSKGHCVDVFDLQIRYICSPF